MLQGFSTAILIAAIAEVVTNGWSKKDYPSYEATDGYWNDYYGHGSTTASTETTSETTTTTSTRTTSASSPTVRISRFTPVPTAVPKDETGLAHLNSLSHVNLYRYYGLEDKEYNLKFLLDAVKKFESYPVRKTNEGKRLACRVPFLSGMYYDEESLRSIAMEALELANGTAIEDIVKFKVAYTLQFNAIMYLKTVAVWNNLPSSSVMSCLNTGTIFKRRLGKAKFLLEQSLLKSEVPIGELEDSIELVMRTPNMSEEFKSLEQERIYVEKRIRYHLQ